MKVLYCIACVMGMYYSYVMVPLSGIGKRLRPPARILTLAFFQYVVGRSWAAAGH